MTSDQEYKYSKIAEKAVKKAGLEVVTIIPDEDYIETICPECNHIGIFHFNEINRMFCEKCNLKKKEENFENKVAFFSKEGFEVIRESFKENYVDVECLTCGCVTSCHIEQLDNIKCKYCELQKLALEKGLNIHLNKENIFSNDEDYVDTECSVCGNIISCHIEELYNNVICKDCELKKRALEKGFNIYFDDCKRDCLVNYDELEKWKEKNKAEPIIFECIKCGKDFIFDREREDILDVVRSLKCNCSEDLMWKYNDCRLLRTSFKEIAEDLEKRPLYFQLTFTSLDPYDLRQFNLSPYTYDSIEKIHFEFQSESDYTILIRDLSGEKVVCKSKDVLLNGRSDTKEMRIASIEEFLQQYYEKCMNKNKYNKIYYYYDF